MVPKAIYRAKAQSGEFGVTPNKGTDFVKVVFVIVDGEHAGERVAWTGWFGPNSKKRTIDSLRYCGCSFPSNDITDLTGIDSEEVEVDVDVETYESQGETKTVAKVNWVNQIGGGVGGVSQELQMDGAKKAAFKQRMMGELLASKPAQSGFTPPATGLAGRKDPIPF